jgi:hypothetical protein
MLAELCRLVVHSGFSESKALLLQKVEIDSSQSRQLIPMLESAQPDAMLAARPAGHYQ